MSIRHEDRILTRTETVLCEPLETGALLLDLDSGRYFELDAAGALLWQNLDGFQTPAQLAGHLAQAYGIDHERAIEDTRAFLAQLHESGLVKPSGGV